MGATVEAEVVGKVETAGIGAIGCVIADVVGIGALEIVEVVEEGRVEVVGVGVGAVIVRFAVLTIEGFDRTEVGVLESEAATVLEIAAPGVVEVDMPVVDREETEVAPASPV